MNRRIAAYSHDTMGLGHLRRTVSICRHLTDRDDALSALIVTGSSFAQAFGARERIDFLKLPAAKKVNNGHYEARYLGVDIDSLTRMRGAIIDESLRTFEPDVLIVDKVAPGMGGELIPALERLRHARKPVKVVLGLRDILDDPETQRREWLATREFEVMERYYDAIWIYGTPEVFDTVREYEFPDALAARSTYLGYLPKYNGLRPAAEVRESLGAGDLPIMVVTTGGGEDGYDLLNLFVAGLEEGCLPRDYLSVLVTGPGMPATRVAELRERIARLPVAHPCRLIEFTDIMTSIFAVADVVVTMAGYNTLTEALCLGRRVVTVPRRWPRLEQWIRAQRLAARDLVTLVDPETATPSTLGAAVRRELTRDQRPADTIPLEFSGFQRLSEEYDRLLRDDSPLAAPVTPGLWSTT